MAAFRAVAVQGRRVSVSAAKLQSVTALVGRMSDRQLKMLEAALIGAAQAGDGGMLNVLDAVGTETTERAAAALALAPLAPLLERAAEQFGPDVSRRFWADVSEFRPEARQQAMAAVLRLRSEDPVPVLFDDLCVEAAARTREGRGRLAACADAGELARFLSLAPIARRLLAQLSTTGERLDAEASAAVRLAFKDAAATDADAAPALLRILSAHQSEPVRALRLISAMSDNMTDQFLAGSELAGVGEALLADMEARVAQSRAVDLADGAQAGRTAAAALASAMHTAAEFELYVRITKDGPWGPRIAQAQRAAAASAEARLRELDSALGAALPLQAARFASRFVKGVPRLNKEPDPRALNRACALAAFLADSRAAANAAGFASLRTKVQDAFEERLAHYVEDLLDILHEDPHADRAAEFLTHAAELVELVEGPSAADIVRRRLSAATHSRSAEASAA